MASNYSLHSTSLVLGFLVLAPIVLIIFIVLVAVVWFRSLKRNSLSLETKDEPSISWLNFMRINLFSSSKEETNGKNDNPNQVRKRRNYNKLSIKRGWLKVSSTPLPMKEPTLLERIQDLLINNWVNSSNFLTNRSSFSTSGKEASIPNTPQNLSGDTLRNKSFDLSLLDGAESQHSQDIAGSIISQDYSASPRSLSTYLTKLPAYLFGAKSELDTPSRSNSEIGRREEILKANDHTKLKHQRSQHEWRYAMLTKTELRLYRDDSCRELLTILNLPLYDVGLYPFDQLENELYRCINPIVLAGHSTLRPDPFRPTTSNSHERHFTVTKNQAIDDYESSIPNKEKYGKTPEMIKPNTDRLSLPIYYLFAESNLDKEEWVQALIGRCRYVLSNSSRLHQNVEKYKPAYLTNAFFKNAKQPFGHNPILLNPSPIDQFALEDLRTRLFGVDRGYDSATTNLFEEGVEDNDNLNWFNALVGRFYLGIKDGSSLNDFLKQKINSKLIQMLPKWVSFSLQSVLLGPRLPRLLSLPELKALNKSGKFELQVPLQHFGPLFDFKFKLQLFAGWMGDKEIDVEELLTVRQFLKAIVKALTTRWLNWKIPIHIKAWLNIGKQEGHPFQTDLIVKMGLPPTNLMYLGFKRLPEPAQLNIHLEIYDRILPIPVQLITILLNRLGEKFGNGNFVPVRILPDHLMQPSTNPTPLRILLASAKLPVLIQTLTKRHLKGRCREESCHDSKSRPSFRKRSCSMATVPLKPKLVALTSDPTASLYPNDFTEPVGGFGVPRNRYSPTVVRIYDVNRGVLPIDQHPQHIDMFSSIKLKVRPQATPKVSAVQVRAPHHCYDSTNEETLFESLAAKRLSQLFLNPNQAEIPETNQSNHNRLKVRNTVGLLNLRVQMAQPSVRVDFVNIITRSSTHLRSRDNSPKYRSLST